MLNIIGLKCCFCGQFVTKVCAVKPASFPFPFHYSPFTTMSELVSYDRSTDCTSEEFPATVAGAVEISGKSM